MRNDVGAIFHYTWCINGISIILQQRRSEISLIMPDRYWISNYGTIDDYDCEELIMSMSKWLYFLFFNKLSLPLHFHHIDFEFLVKGCIYKKEEGNLLKKIVFYTHTCGDKIIPQCALDITREVYTHDGCTLRYNTDWQSYRPQNDTHTCDSKPNYWNRQGTTVDWISLAAPLYLFFIYASAS